MSTRISIRVIPNASTTGVVGAYGDGWKVKVQTPPEGGRANKAVIECLAKALGVPKRSISLESGDKSRDKILLVEGLTDTEVAHLIGQLGQ